jgi:hypothetical protein
MATTRTISDAFSPIFSNMLLISRSQGHIRKIRARALIRWPAYPSLTDLDFLLRPYGASAAKIPKKVRA